MPRINNFPVKNISLLVLFLSLITENFSFFFIFMRCADEEEEKRLPDLSCYYYYI